MSKTSKKVELVYKSLKPLENLKIKNAKVSNFTSYPSEFASGCHYIRGLHLFFENEKGEIKTISIIAYKNRISIIEDNIPNLEKNMENYPNHVCMNEGIFNIEKNDNSVSIILAYTHSKFTILFDYIFEDSLSYHLS